MSEPRRTSAKQGGRVGRPALVDREMIADAAAQMSLTDLTMRSVAERLGVSVTSLYYHVRDSEELRNLAAERAAAKHPVPVARGQHWAVWLYEWADHTRVSFVAEPGLLDRYLFGTLGLGSVLSNLDAVVALMEEQGFDPSEAMDAYGLVSACAVGAAVNEIRDTHSPPGSRSWEDAAEKAARKVPRRLEHLARIQRRSPVPFKERIATVIVGIAVRRGDRVSDVLEALESA